MKHLFATVILVLATTVQAKPIDKDLRSEVIETPTLRGSPFCGFPTVTMMANLHYICDALGFSSYELLERENGHTDGCWAASIVGSGTFLSFDKTMNPKITKVRCSNLTKLPDKAPDIPNKPVPPCLKPDCSTLTPPPHGYN